MVERQPIRPTAAAKSFAGSAAFTPFHTDSQDFLGAPPACRSWCAGAPRRSAARPGCSTGGPCSTGSSAPTARCTRRSRARRACTGSTSATSRGPPSPSSRSLGVDALADASDRRDRHGARARARARAGDRGHGPRRRDAPRRQPPHAARTRRVRRNDREFVRVLAWFARPLAEHPAQRGEQGRSSLGRLTVVLEMLVGVAPSRLAAREGVSEAELYEWRNRALSAAKAALDAEEFVPPV